jgi:peptidyl-prolyl cis-trans isomerase A (cyclophilin A)
MIAIIAALLLQAATPAPPPAAAEPAAAPPAPAAAEAKLVHVALKTSVGDITLALDSTHAPITTANFLRYVTQHRLDGTTFYRAMKLSEGLGLIQGGARNDPKRLLPPIAHEPTTQTGLTHDDGAISMARYTPGSATADFFIIVRGMHTLDADPSQAGDDQGFAVFGHVTDGMDVVRKILDAPTSPTAGEGAMKGQMMADPVRIISARRID